MNLLLLLSALLSAIAGTGTIARAPAATMAVQTVAVATQVRAARVAVPGRPVAGLPARGATISVALPMWRLAPTAPIWLIRRRE